MRDCQVRYPCNNVGVGVVARWGHVILFVWGLGTDVIRAVNISMRIFTEERFADIPKKLNQREDHKNNSSILGFTINLDTNRCVSLVGV